MKYKNVKIVGSLLKTQTYNYFSDPVNIVLGILLTSVTMLCWVAFKPTEDSGISTDHFVLASAIGITSIRNAQYNLNCTLVEWRGTRFIRNILTTPVSKRTLYFSILLFNWIVNIVAAVLLFTLAMFFNSQRMILHNIQWTPFLIGFWLNVLLSNIMALLISGLVKNRDYVLIISGLSYFLPMYILGLGIPWSTVGQFKVIFFITYLFPHRFTLHLMQAAWTGNANDMSFLKPNDYDGDWSNTWLGQHNFGYGNNGWWFPCAITVTIIILLTVIFTLSLNKNYKFGLRKYAKYKGVKSHLNHIEMIKKSSSVIELKQYIELAELDKKPISYYKKRHMRKMQGK